MLQHFTLFSRATLFGERGLWCLFLPSIYPFAQLENIYISDKVGYADRGVARNLEQAAYHDPVALKRMIKHSFWLLQRDYQQRRKAPCFSNGDISRKKVSI